MTGYVSNKMKQMLLFIRLDMPIMPVLFIQIIFPISNPMEVQTLPTVSFGVISTHITPLPPAPVKIYQPGLQIITVALLRTLYNV